MVVRAASFGIFLLVVSFAVYASAGKVITNEMSFNFKNLLPPLGCIGQDSCCPPSVHDASVYVNTNRRENTISHFSRYGNGTLRFAGHYKTHGNGDPDVCLGASAMVRHENTLAVINTGSGDVSLFKIQPVTGGLSYEGKIVVAGQPTGLAFSKDGEILFVADVSFVVGFDVETGIGLYATESLGGKIYDLAVIGDSSSPSGERLIVAGDGGLCNWDLSFGFEGMEESECVEGYFRSVTREPVGAPHQRDFYASTGYANGELVLYSYRFDPEIKFQTSEFSTTWETEHGVSSISASAAFSTIYVAGADKRAGVFHVDPVYGGISYLHPSSDSTADSFGSPSNVVNTNSWVYVLNSELGTLAVFSTSDKGTAIHRVDEIKVDNETFFTGSSGLLVVEH